MKNNSEQTKKLSKHAVTTVSVVLFLLFGWFLISLLSRKDSILVPNPVGVLTTLLKLAVTLDFWKDVWASCFRVMLAFIISIAVAYPLVLFSLHTSRVRRIVFLFTEFFRYLPVPVFIPLTILWFGVDDAGKVFIVFLGTFAQMIPMFYDSANSLSKSYLSFTATLKWDKVKEIQNIVVPGSAPLVWDNARICLGWAWTYLVIAELLGAEHGLGFAIIRAQRYLATDRIFAYVITIGLIGLVSDRILIWLRKILFKWK